MRVQGPMCFRCPIFNLSGPCELLFLLCFCKCNVVSLYVVCCSVNVSVCFVCCVLDSVCELFGEIIRNVCGCSCYFVVECVCCACDPNERLSAPSICFVCVFVCRKLSLHLGV